jgi:DNA-binding transcriptional regulator YhcF (GntR family)
MDGGPPIEPSYRRIAQALCARIDAGELRPGDRLPSTRELARESSVAPATAAHALRTLVSEGWARTVPRVGTLVASPRRSATAREPVRELTQSAIVQAALAIADAEGLQALSFRAVAARLGAPVMSLYRHVDGKDELLRLIADAAVSEEALPKSVPIAWRPRLELAARLEWRTFCRHPWLARLMSVTRPVPSPIMLTYANFVLLALEGTGLDAATRMRFHIVLHGFVQGIAVNLESEVEAASQTGLSDEEWMETRLDDFTALADSGRYPAFARVIRELDGDFDHSLDRIFELGLGVVLDGFARQISQRR